MQFNTSYDDMARIHLVLDRARALGVLNDESRHERASRLMDFDAVHSNGNPMRFDLMLMADDANFLHDFCGIVRHLDRNTGKLRNGFSPRFSAAYHKTEREKAADDRAHGRDRTNGQPQAMRMRMTQTRGS